MDDFVKLIDDTDVGNVGAQYRVGIDIMNRSRDTLQALPWISSAAERGYARAQVHIGEFYQKGTILPQDFAKALDWYLKAAEQGDGLGMYHVALCYFNGEGVERDLEKAIELCRSAAEKGEPAAQYELGACYDYGYGVERDLEQALIWYRQAAENNHGEARFSLARCYQFGYGVEADGDMAMYWYERAMISPMPRRKQIQTVDNINRLIAEGYSAVLFGMFATLRTSSDATIKPAKSATPASPQIQNVNDYQQAALQGDKNAQYLLGLSFFNGRGVDSDRNKATEWYRMAAEQGHAMAQYRLANCYRNGHGVVRNGNMAMYWFEKATKNSDKTLSKNEKKQAKTYIKQLKSRGFSASKANL